jgi:hypothetical protein
MSFLQAIPESGQLFLLGSSLFVMSFVFRKLRKLLSGLRAPLTADQQPEPRES